MGEDILSVIFLVLICIVIAGIIYKTVPSQMMIPTFALVAVCLWIALDYILMQRYQIKKSCDVPKVNHDPLDDQINRLTQELNLAENSKSTNVSDNSKSTNVSDDSKSTNVSDDSKSINVSDNSPPSTEKNLTPEAKHKNEFDIDLYDKQLSIKELFKDSGCTGDTRIANRMKYMGLQARMSQDIRARWNTEKLRPYLEEELSDNENRDWWDVETDYLDILM